MMALFQATYNGTKYETTCYHFTLVHQKFFSCEFNCDMLSVACINFLTHKEDSLYFKMWCEITTEMVNGTFIIVEKMVRSHSFLNMFELYTTNFEV